MHARPKKKLCWNCEGGVEFAQENCPYCGVYLHPGVVEDQPKIASLFSPPYPQMEEEVEEERETVLQEKQPVSIAKKREDDAVSTLLFTWLLLASGLLFSLFGLVIFLFSNQGALVLRWDYDMWWLFFFSGITLLFLGYRFLSKL